MSGNSSNHVWVVDSTKATGGYWTRQVGNASGGLSTTPINKTTAQRDALLTDGSVGAVYNGLTIHNTTTGYNEVYEGDGTTNTATDWRYEQQHTKGGHAQVQDAFKPSQDYIDDLTMDGTAQSVALATGVALGKGRIRVWNKGATTENIRFAFGTSEANAEANLTHSTNRATTGIEIPPYADGGTLCMQTFGVPDNATHYAVENGVASDVQAVQVVQGV